MYEFALVPTILENVVTPYEIYTRDIPYCLAFVLKIQYGKLKNVNKKLKEKTYEYKKSSIGAKNKKLENKLKLKNIT